MTFCYQCGKPIDEGSRFCPGCGAHQKTADSFAAPDSFAPPQDHTPQGYVPQEPVYAPPQQDHVQPQQPYSPPQQDYIQPQQQYSPPQQDHVQPQQPYSPPQQDYAQPQQPYYPPQQDYAQPQSPYNAQQPPYGPPNPQRPANSEYPLPDSKSYYPGAMSPAKKKPNKFLMIGVPIIAVVAIAAAVFALFFFRTTPLLAASRALASLSAETTERLDATPLKAISMLGETLKDGTMNVDFDYRHWSGSSLGGSVTLSSNYKDRDYAIKAEISENGDDFDAAFYMNKERLAIGSSLIDDNYYGFRYSTFREDIRSLGDLTGLDDDTMDALSDIVKMIDDMMNMEDAGEANVKIYTDVMTKFINNCEVTSERDTVESGGSSTRCTRVDIVVTEDALFTLLDDYINLIEDDETFSKYMDLFSNQTMGGAAGYFSGAYDQTISGFRKSARDFERKYTGDITISMFVGSRNRLLKIEIDADVKYDGERLRIKGIFDFGESAKDKWTFNISLTEGGKKNSVKLVWDYKERTSSVENTITITSSDDDTITLRSSWSPEKGNFTLSYEDDWSKNEISGVFKPGDDGFRLSFDNLLESGYRDESLSIEIDVKSGARISQIDYINIDMWGEDFLEQLGGLAGGAIAVPDYPSGGPSGANPSSGLFGYGGNVWVTHYSEISFTPDYSGWWEIYTWDNGSSDPYIEIYDDRGVYIGSDDDSGGDFNSYINIFLDGGVTYTIIVDFYSGEADGCMLSVWEN